jgi:Uma2 family endonuclease
MQPDLDTFIKLDELGFKVELTAGLTTLETSPMAGHQDAIDAIRSSIRLIANSSLLCACVHKSDVYIRFTDGSLKRPDISVFCRQPDEIWTPITLVPEAVIEVISDGYERKDLELNPPFYLENGVKDILIFDPRSKMILHHRKEWTEPKKFSSPARFELECGCEVTI